MEVFKTFSHHSDGLTLTALSDEVNLHKATVSRFPVALEKISLAERSSVSKIWPLGTAIFEMTARAARRNELREIALPIIERLAREIVQTVQLDVLVGNGVVYVGKVEPSDL